MDVRSKNKAHRFGVLIIAAIFLGLEASAQVSAPQTPAPVQPAPPFRKANTAMRTTPVVVDNRAAAPQVVTILHRLNGL